jgi:hypothetical protein
LRALPPGRSFRAVPRRGPTDEVGSLEWTRHRNGLLTTRRERFDMAVQFVKAAAEHYSTKLALWLGRPRRPPAELDLDRVPMPRTEAARAAEEMIEETMDPVWVHHSYRTYVWGYVLGRHDGLEFDEEVLYVASLVHDVSLADPNIAVGPRCFTLAAAESADSLVARYGWDPARRHLIGDAITRHVNLWIPKRQDPEAYLLHVGTKLDGIGLRYHELSPKLVDHVLERYPRLNFKEAFRPKIRAHGAAVPDSRAGFYATRLRADSRRASSPFSE